MKQLEHFNEWSDAAVGGLHADDRLKYKILQEARHPAGGKGVRLTPMQKRITAAACALLILSGVLLTQLPHREQSPITVISAGQPTAGPAVSASGNLRVGSLSVGRDSAEGSLWATGGNPWPMLRVNGRWYRMLNTGAGQIAADQIIGTVALYTDEPGLMEGSEAISNICPAGTEIRTAAGLDGALIAVQLDGQQRLFQRISFNGSAVQGHETLNQTLGIRDHAQSYTLTGLGSVSDPENVRQLTGLLLDSAVLDSAAVQNSNQFLLITLDNGAVLQMTAANDRLSACGTWVCPEFFEAFSRLVSD